jgi:hypothetical protein
VSSPRLSVECLREVVGKGHDGAPHTRILASHAAHGLMGRRSPAGVEPAPIADGCPAGVMAGDSHRVSAAALRRRGLVTTAGRGSSWRARIAARTAQ